MVKSGPLLTGISVVYVLMFLGTACAAWTGTYRIEREWVELWINKDGTVDLFYNISITLESGDDINYVFVGQPKPDFTIGQARDQYGHMLQAFDASSGSDYKVRVNLHSPLTEGHTIWFTVTTNVGHMIYEDTDNPGNVGMQFIPTWWEEAAVLDIRMRIVLPSNVTKEMVKTSVNWNNTSYEGDHLAIYWEKQNLSPNQQFPVGVSFPKEYVQSYQTQPGGVVAFFQRYGVLLLTLGFFGCLIGIVVYVARKRSYQKPKIGIETLGIRHGLTAVEASYLLELVPTRIVTEILYSLLKKRAIWVESTTPSLKLKGMPPFQDGTGTPQTPLRYYEIDFLKAMREDGTLDEEKLAETVTYLRDSVEQKMRGYCRRDTMDYYTDVVAQAWRQVEEGGTPELASEAYDQQLLWLFLDPNHKSRTEEAFQDKNFEPSPFWVWYWYTYRHYHPNPHTNQT